MGRRLDVLLGRTTKQTARLRSLLGLAVTRLGVVRGHRQVRCAQARGDVEQLLRLGHADRALARAEHVVREQNALDVLAELEAYCGLIVERAALVDAHRECPEELREAAAGLVYAAARCGDLPELQEVKSILAAKFGRGFVSAASELRSGCGINPKVRIAGEPSEFDIHDSSTQHSNQKYMSLTKFDSPCRNGTDRAEAVDQAAEPREPADGAPGDRCGERVRRERLRATTLQRGIRTLQPQPQEDEAGRRENPDATS
jgi:vacuolar protein sorting-associated protein IST1